MVKNILSANAPHLCGTAYWKHPSVQAGKPCSRERGIHMEKERGDPSLPHGNISTVKRKSAGTERREIRRGGKDERNIGRKGPPLSGKIRAALLPVFAIMILLSASSMIFLGESEGIGYPDSAGMGVADSDIYVTDITDVPAMVMVGIPLTLGVTVIPINATNQTITWNIIDAGDTGTSLNGNILTATNAGTITVMATIEEPHSVFTMISGGTSHTVAVRSDGTLWAWGLNSSGQLGLDDTINRNIPQRVGSDADWKYVSAGREHTTAIKEDGTIWTWGNNTNGQLGDGTITQRSSPVRVGEDNDWKHVSAGSAHTIAIKDDGTLWAWGNNTNGQLGDGTITQRSSPVQVGEDNDWKYVSAGGSHTMALRTNDTLWAWGLNSSGQLGVDNTTNAPVQVGTLTWNSVSAGENHTVAIRSDGSLWAWGNNGNGKLGDNSSMNRTSPTRIGADLNWRSISAGVEHTMAIRTDGTLWAWGNNQWSQFGNGDNTEKRNPTRSGTDTDWESLSFRGNHVTAFKTDGTSWIWGNNQYGQLGDGNTSARLSPAQTGTDTWKSISTGESHAAAVRSDGTLWTWGNNADGQLGNGTYISSLSPIRIGTDSDWKSVSVGCEHTVAIKTNGTLWTWGGNYDYQLGLGDKTNRPEPTRVGTATTWASISAGGYHTAAVRTDGTLWTWGDNWRGQLGLGNSGNNTHRTIPTQVGALTTWASVSAGEDHTLAVRTDGSLWAWGDNRNDQLGLNGGADRSTPTRVGTLNTWASVSTGTNHTLAVRTDGSLWAWGSNGNGKLGLGNSGGTQLTPARVGTDNNWASATAGHNHSVAVKTNGTLWSWGYNAHGQLGDGTIVQKTSPVQTGTDTNWTQASAGRDYTAALSKDNKLWSWGSNSLGRLGIGGSAVPSQSETTFFTKNFDIMIVDLIDRTYQYEIIGSGTSFTATGSGSVNGEAITYRVHGAVNTSIQNVIDAINADADGNDCTITFGNNESILNIGTANINLDTGTWGIITLKGALTSAFSNAADAVILVSDDVNIVNHADITGTGTNATVSVIRNNGTGSVSITEGVVQQSSTANNFAIYNNSSGTVSVSGGIVQCNTNGIAIHNQSTGIINVSGGTVQSTNNAIVSTGAGLIVLGGDPVIIGNINVAQNRLSVLTTGDDAFAPSEGRMYNVTLSGTASNGHVMAVNGGSFIEHFTLTNIGSRTMGTVGSDIVLGSIVTFDINGGTGEVPESMFLRTSYIMSADKPTGTWTMDDLDHGNMWYVRAGNAPNFTYTPYVFGSTTVSGNITLSLLWTQWDFVLTNGSTSTNFTATVMLHDGPYAIRSNTTLSNAISDIRGFAGGNDCTITFGSDGSALNLTSNAIFNNTGGTWGIITLKGTLTSSGSTVITADGSLTIMISGDIMNTGTGQAITAGSNVNIVLISDPMIAGNITVAQNRLSVLTTGDNAFAPSEGRMYNVTLSGTVITNNTAVANGADFIANFRLTNVGWGLGVSGSDIVTAMMQTVMFNLNGSTGTAPSSMTTVSGSTIESAPAAEAWTFGDWQHDGNWYIRSGTVAPFTYTPFVFGPEGTGTTVTGNITLHLIWTQYEYIITGSGTNFTATKILENGTVNVADGTIQNVIDVIRTDARGNASTITFGSDSALNTGNENISLNNAGGTWGLVTLNGALISAFNTAGAAVILLSDDVSIISNANITGTGDNANVSVIRNNGTGTISIFGGTISANGINAIVSANIDSSVVLGGDPTINGGIFVSPNRLSVITTGEDTFEPSAKTYTVFLSGMLSSGLKAVVNAASFNELFTVNHTWTVEAKDNDLVITHDMAHWYTVTFNSDNGEDPRNEFVRMFPPSPVTKPQNPSSESFVFTGWFSGAAEWVFTNVVTENMTLTAQWSFKVTFDPDNGEQTWTELVPMSSPSALTKPEGVWVKDGHISRGKWYFGEDATEFVFGESSVTYSKTLFMEWVAASVSMDTTTAMNGEFGKEYSLMITASLEGGAAGTITFEFTGGLPPGLDFNGSTGVISGIPRSLGEFTFTIFAFSEITGEKDERTFTMTVEGGYYYWSDEKELPNGGPQFSGIRSLSSEYEDNKFASLSDAFNSGRTGTLTVVGSFFDDLNGMELDFGSDVDIIFEGSAKVTLMNGIVKLKSINVSGGTLALCNASLMLSERMSDTGGNGTVELINSNVSAESVEVSDLKVNGEVTVNGDAVVGTMTSLGDGPADLTINGSLDADSVNMAGNMNVINNMAVTGDTFIDGNADIGGNLVTGTDGDGTGNVSVTGNLDTGGSADIGGNLSTGGSANIGDDLTVGGDLNVGGDADIGGELKTGDGGEGGSGNVNIGGDLNVGGDADIGGVLDTGGDLILGGITISVGKISDRFHYTGYEIRPDVTVTHDGKVLTDGIDYMVTYSDNVNVGNAKIFIKFINGYDHISTMTRSFTIVEAIDESSSSMLILLTVIIGFAVIGGAIFIRARMRSYTEDVERTGTRKKGEIQEDA